MKPRFGEITGNLLATEYHVVDHVKEALEENNTEVFWLPYKYS